jgi:DNA-directed RNA polymerase specialized sigma24 family protein
VEKEKQQLLLQGFVKGSRKDFNQLFQKYRKAIKGFIVSHSFGQLKQKVDDIEQETWILIWEKRTQFDMARSFYSFVCYWAKIMIKRYFSKIREQVSIDEEDFNEGDLVESREPVCSQLSTEMEELFTVTMTCGGPPHQLLAFGFNKLLSQWKPRKIVSELADIPFKQLVDILIKDYLAASHLPEGLVTYLFWPLSSTMQQSVNQVLDDEISKNTYKAILDKQVGETCLRAYFGQDAVHNISDWTYKVRSRVIRYFKKKQIKSRDKTYLKNVC